MLCCGIHSFNDMKLYIKNYLRMFDIHEDKSVMSEIENEWENISIPRGQ